MDPLKGFLFWPLSGESKLNLNDVDMSRSLQVLAAGGLHTPDVVALVALIAQNHPAGVVSAPADSAMKIWPPVEPIRV